MACLVITTGEQAGKYFQLTSRTLTAGRDPAREIQLLDPKVSRRHFQVRKEGDGYLILELRSVNGVFVNGQKVAEKLLADGDEIVVGDTKLKYYLDDQPDRTNALNKPRAAQRKLREDQTIIE